MVTCTAKWRARLPSSPFGEYVREKRTAAGKSLREVADALSISHVYLGEVERGRRRILPEKHWKKLARAVPGVSVQELKERAAFSEPIDPVAVQGTNRELVVALARRLDEADISESLARELIALLESSGRRK